MGRNRLPILTLVDKGADGNFTDQGFVSQVEIAKGLPAVCVELMTKWQYLTNTTYYATVS